MDVEKWIKIREDQIMNTPLFQKFLALTLTLCDSLWPESGAANSVSWPFIYDENGSLQS